MTSRLAASGTSSPLKVTLAVNKVVAEHARPMADAMLEAARQADTVPLTPAGWIGGHVAEKSNHAQHGRVPAADDPDPGVPAGLGDHPLAGRGGATTRRRPSCGAWGSSRSARSSTRCEPNSGCRR